MQPQLLTISFEGTYMYVRLLGCAMLNLSSFPYFSYFMQYSTKCKNIVSTYLVACETKLKPYQMHPEYQLECCFHQDGCGELCCYV